MYNKVCAVWFTLLATGFHMHSVNGSNDTQQIRSCDVFGTCSQVCTTYADAVNCSCAEGFKLNENGWGCDPFGPSWKLLYSTVNYSLWNSALSMWDSRTKNTTISIIPKWDKVHGITYDARNIAIYTAGRKDGIFSVIRTSFRNRSSVELFKVPAHDLAFDWTTGNIYFTDDIYFRILVCKNDSNNCAVLIDESVNEPKHIALHPASGLLFWTEDHPTPGIMRAGMDGSQPRQIISLDLWYAELTVSVDQANERIYFARADGKGIQSFRFDGSDKNIVVAGEIAGHPNNLNLFGDRLIWYDSKSYKIKVQKPVKYVTYTRSTRGELEVCKKIQI